MNTVALMGRLTYSPELKSTKSGVSVTDFQIAVDRAYVQKGQERQADFIDCVAFRQTAEFIHRWFSKGSMIAVEGTLQSENYTDKDGNSRKSIKVVANNVSFCGEKQKEAEPSFSVKTEDNKYDIEELVDDDDLPF